MHAEELRQETRKLRLDIRKDGKGLSIQCSCHLLPLDFAAAHITAPPGPSTVLCVYEFRANHLVLDNQ